MRCYLFIIIICGDSNLCVITTAFKPLRQQTIYGLCKYKLPIIQSISWSLKRLLVSSLKEPERELMNRVRLSQGK